MGKESKDTASPKKDCLGQGVEISKKTAGMLLLHAQHNHTRIDTYLMLGVDIPPMTDVVWMSSLQILDLWAHPPQFISLL